MYISCNLLGRLGNYFFTIISSWAYAKKYDLNFVMHISFKNNKYYNIYFNKINLMDDCDEIYWRNKEFDTFENSLIKYYDKEYNYIFNGYLQNANNFDIYRNEVLNYFFDIKEPLKPNNNFFIHIRLTDFLTSPNHNIDLDNYYNKAITLALNRINLLNANIYVISDDINKAKEKEYLKLLPKNNLIFLDNLLYDEVKTINIFKNCYLGCIIGNSTFAWWGAYIINNPSKLVYVPSKFLNQEADYSCLYLNYQVINI